MTENPQNQPPAPDQATPVVAEPEEIPAEGRAESDVGQPAAPEAGLEVAQSKQGRKPKAPPVTTLVELFTAKGGNAGKLLRELEKSPSWSFAADDVETALGLLPEHDPHLQRTRQLLHEAIETRDGRFRRTAGDFAICAKADDLRDAGKWPPEDGIEPLEALTSVAEVVRTRLRDPKAHRRNHNVLMIAVDVLSDRHGLAFEEAAPVLRAAIGRPPQYEKSKSNPRRHRIAAVTELRNDLARVQDLLDLLQPWEDDVRRAERQAQEADAGRTEADARTDAAHQRAEQLEGRIAELERELESVRQALAAASDESRDVEIFASSDVAELKARSLAFINTRLRDLLSTAKDASEVEPPRAQTAARLLNQALTEIQKEAEWLRSSG
jgi:hypothetical protein